MKKRHRPVASAARLAERLAEVAARVRTLANRDPFRTVFGSAGPTGHDYRIGRRLSEKELHSFEERWRVRLPAAYRAFLTRVGNGGAGPSYGLLPFAKAIEGRKPVSAPFPYRDADARRVMTRRASGREPYAFIGDDEDVPGVVALCEDGCGWVTYLVVSGEQRGKVWTGGELGFCPAYFTRGGKPVQHTFLSWYAAWLRKAMRETRVKPFAPPPGHCFNLNAKLVGALPDALFDCSHVEELSLSANKLKTLPAAIGRLRKLRTLDLGGNMLEELPDAIGDLDALEELHLAFNELATLPDAIRKLRSLRVLGLQSNPLRELPEAMAALTTLRRLLLGNTALTRLPLWLSAVGLEELQLDAVQIEDWDALSAFGGASSTLKQLWLSMNPKLDRIPDAVFEIESLAHLVMGATALSEIPPAIARLRNLVSLGLANTQVRSLPDELCALPLLTSVVLQGAPMPREDRDRAMARWPRIAIT